MKAYNGGKPVFNEGMSPIGLFVHLYHDKPQLKTKDQYGKVPDIDPDTGIQRAEYKSTLAWEKTRVAELQEIIAMAQKTQEEAWPGSTAPGAFFALEPFFRDGDNPAHNTEGRDYLKGKYYLNFKSKAKVEKDPTTGNPVYSGAPGLLGPYGPEDKIMPADLWPGCTGRVSFIMFGTEYMGKHFISTRMQNLQKYDEGDGTRIGGGQRPAAESQFGAIKQAPAGGLGGFGLGNPQPQQQANPFGNAPGLLGGAPASNPFGAPQQSPTNPFAPGGGRIF
jgi:hypothetical protein